MRPLFFILPFLALLTLCSGLALSSLFADIPYLAYGGWALASVLLCTWLVLDWQAFKAACRRPSTRHGLSTGVQVLLTMFVFMAVAILSNRPRFDRSFDLTATATHTLSAQSLSTIKLLREPPPLQVTAYFTQPDAAAGFRHLLRLYQQAGLEVNVDFRDPLVQVTLAKADHVQTPAAVIVRRQTHEVRLASLDEQGFTNALLMLLQPSTKAIYLTSGHGEAALEGEDASGLTRLAQELKSYRYPLTALQLNTATRVPADAGLVMVIGPRYNFTVQEVQQLRHYLQQGGAVLIMASALTAVDSLNGLLQDYQLSLEPDLIVLPPDDARVKMLGQNVTLVSTFHAHHPLTAQFASLGHVSFQALDSRSVRQLEQPNNSTEVSLLAHSIADNVRVKDVYEEADLAELSADRVEQGPFPFMAVATRQSTAGAGRLLVLGSSHLATNQGITLASHRDFVLNAINYLVRDEQFITLRPSSPLASTLKIERASSVIVLAILCFIYPLLFLASGGLIYLRRRQKA